MKPLAFLDEVKVPSTFVIAPSDAVNKERADLILTGVPADDMAAINNAITALHTARGEDTDIAIRIDFMGGTIDLGTLEGEDAIVIPVGYDNIYLYGNGVKIVGDVGDSDYVEMYSIFTNNADSVIIDGFNIVNNSSDYGNGLYNTGTNCTITGNTCSSSDYNGLSNSGTNCTITGNTCSSSSSGSGGMGLHNTGTNCTITGNTCSSSGRGLHNTGTNCTITSNTCSSNYGKGLYNSSTSTTDKCIIIGNICTEGGISVKTGTCLPATQEAMADVNTGTITIRE